MNDDQQLLERRFATLGRRAPLFYDRPLHLVRGEGCRLWDADGRTYLDAYNNVPHVGHCHPRVVEALCHQAARLNIHTRYLDETVIAYAERLIGTFPAGLDRIAFCCTGSEANELALRVARTRTRKQGIIVSDFSYHGNTSGLAVLTTGLPTPEPFAPFARAVPVPNPYHAGESDPVALHLALLDEAIASLDQAGFGVAALLFDTIFSTEGLPSLPTAYLQGAVERVRRAGGLFIADEVQPGFGRMGEAMWGFQLSGVTPDLVTLGKPMGNGHPVTAMIGRADLFDDFAERSLYFNTFGGNAVSAAVGLAVLEVLETERLPARAAETGARLRRGLAVLAERHEMIGDIRGQGLFLGVEIVQDRVSRTPDAERTRRIVNRMRDNGVLISRIGPQDNVLKIRPPMVFGAGEADEFLSALSLSLEQTEDAR